MQKGVTKNPIEKFKCNSREYSISPEGGRKGRTEEQRPHDTNKK